MQNALIDQVSAAEHLADAKWISRPGSVPPAGCRPAPVFRRTFELQGLVREAQLTITAHGVYEAFINGTRVGDQELTPGLTSYAKTLYVQQYDVTALLRSGENELTVVLSDGWFRGRTGAHRVPDSFGTETALLATLTGRLEDSTFSVVTDDSWETGLGTIVAADLMDGQTTDLRRTGLTEWGPVVLSTGPLTKDRSRLGYSPAPPVRKAEQYRPVRIKRLPSGRQIVDFGQDLNGWVELRALGPADTTVVLTHGEALDPDGDLTLDHLDITVLPGLPPLPVGQVDRVTSRGVRGDVFEPRHTSHGFRYVAVDGLDHHLDEHDLVAHQVRSDMRHTGSFACSDDRLDALHRIAVASWRSNTLDVPTDCPQRERWGYTGDFQIFARSAAFLDDIDGFAAKWLQSLRDDQHADGKVTNVAPDCGIEAEPVVPISFDGSAGWGDAVTIIPWELFRAYGDPAVLEESFPAMTAWVDYVAATARSGRHASRAARGEAQEHEQYIWDTGWHWGEWLEPDVPFSPQADPAIVATAYFARSAQLVADAASVLGDVEATERYSALATRVVEAWRTEFLDDDGTLTVPTQANHVRALAFGLVPAELVEPTADALVELVERNGNHLGTGFLSTGMLLPVLAGHGYADVAYDVLFQDGEPGWMVMLERGATTVWEAWNGIDADGRPHESLNHYSKGAVIDFLHSVVAGIAPATPGYRSVMFRPRPDPRVTWAEGSIETRHGLVRSRWEVQDGRMQLRTQTPDGVAATVHLPDGRVVEAEPGAHSWESDVPVVAPRPRYERTSAPDAVETPDPASGLTWGRLDPERTVFGDLLGDPAAVAVLERAIPGITSNPMVDMARPIPFGQVLPLATDGLTDDQRRAVWAGLAAL